MDAMQSKSDANLLREYAETGNEPAFNELVRRYANQVYSAALRQIDSADVAPEIAQRVFIGLAYGARALAPKFPEDASLAGWLCRSTRNIALNLRRDEFRRHSRERQAMETSSQAPESPPDWESLRAIFDEAMSKLSEADYDAVVMRYFNNQDLRSVGRALGVSDDAAQKRVSRALDKLRHYLSRRGISASTTTLCVALSGNAVQAAPAGLVGVISTAVTVVRVAAPASAAAAATKAITMTTLQKALVTLAFATGVGGGFYETRRAAPSPSSSTTSTSNRLAFWKGSASWNSRGLRPPNRMPRYKWKISGCIATRMKLSTCAANWRACRLIHRSWPRLRRWGRNGRKTRIISQPSCGSRGRTGSRPGSPPTRSRRSRNSNICTRTVGWTWSRITTLPLGR